MTQDRSDFLDDFLALLVQNGIRYAVIGGQGVNAYAEPLVSLDLDVAVATDDLDRIERLLPELVLLASKRIGTRRVADHERLAVGLRTPTVGALLVAEAIEQCVRAGGIEFDAAPIAGVVADDTGRGCLSA